MSNFASKLGQIGPRSTNLGLFKISFSRFWLKLILKSPRFVPFGPIWPNLDGKFDIPACRPLKVFVMCHTWQRYQMSKHGQIVADFIIIICQFLFFIKIVQCCAKINIFIITLKICNLSPFGTNNAAQCWPNWHFWFDIIMVLSSLSSYTLAMYRSSYLDI